MATATLWTAAVTLGGWRLAARPRPAGSWSLPRGCFRAPRRQSGARCGVADTVSGARSVDRWPMPGAGVGAYVSGLSDRLLSATCLGSLGSPVRMRSGRCGGRAGMRLAGEAVT
jgi:hypothetical protein